MLTIGVMVFLSVREGFVLTCEEKDFMRLYFGDVETKAAQKEDYYNWQLLTRFKRARKQMGFAR